MSLHDRGHVRALGALANVRMSGPAQSPNGRAGRFVVAMRSVLGGAIGLIRNIQSRPTIRSQAVPIWSPAPGSLPSVDVIKLGRGARGIRGTVVRVVAENGAANHGISAAELERRLVEIGFVEGAAVEILHEGFIRRDPIAVRLDDTRVALRRREADAILVRVFGESAPGRLDGQLR